MRRRVSYNGEGNVSGGFVGFRSDHEGRRNSRSRRGDSVALVAREREARTSVCGPRLEGPRRGGMGWGDT